MRPRRKRNSTTERWEKSASSSSTTKCFYPKSTTSSGKSPRQLISSWLPIESPENKSWFKGWQWLPWRISFRSPFINRISQETPSSSPPSIHCLGYNSTSKTIRIRPSIPTTFPSNQILMQGKEEHEVRWRTEEFGGGGVGGRKGPDLYGKAVEQDSFRIGWKMIMYCICS